MTINQLLEKYTALEDQLDDKIAAEKDLFKTGTADLFKSIIHDFIDELKQLSNDSQDFRCDYLIKIDEDSIPRCKVHAYCNPKGCKDREVNGKAVKPYINKVPQAERQLFWEDGMEVADDK